MQEAYPQSDPLPVPTLVPKDETDIMPPEPKREYLDGVYYEMAGASRNHLDLSGNLYTLLKSALKGKHCQPYYADMKLLLPEQDNYFYPDLIVECPPGTSDYVEQPTMIVEVLSPSTRMYDTTVKKPIYLGMASLRHLLFIDPFRFGIEHYFRSELTPIWQYEWLSSLDDELYLRLWELKLPLSAIYEDINIG